MGNQDSSAATTEKRTFQPKWIEPNARPEADPTTCGKLNT